jgi:hypothetical protein
MDFFNSQKALALRWNYRVRHRNAYLARVKTTKLLGGDPILVLGTVIFLYR